MGAANVRLVDYHPDVCAEEEPEISIVMPCLNEERTIGQCIEKAQKALRDGDLRGEIIVADNGSTDRSVEICREHGVHVVHQSRRGYGNAYLKGIAAARGRYIVMADSDNTYDLTEIGRFVEPLRAGNDLVMGNRFAGEILPGAMTWSHRYIGNPVLSALMRLMFGTTVGDSHSGIRAFTRDAYARLGLSAPGMEFASEMVINATKVGLKVAEVPITYYPRDGESKLRTLRDGWRHLRYMLLRCPTYLFTLPGLVMLIVGLAALAPFLFGPVVVAGRAFDIHAMFLVGMGTMVGFQLLTLGLFARLLALREGIGDEDRLMRILRSSFTLERGIMAGLALLAIGGALGGLVLAKWFASEFGELSLADTRVAFFGFVGVVLGVQTIFSSFYLICVLGLQAVDRRADE